MAKASKERWSGEDRALSHAGLGIGGAREVFLGNVGSKRRLQKKRGIRPDVAIAQRLASEARSSKILESSRLLKGMDAPSVVWSADIAGYA